MMIDLKDSVVTQGRGGHFFNSKMPSDFLSEFLGKQIEWWQDWLNMNGIEFLWARVSNERETWLPEKPEGDDWVLLASRGEANNLECLWGRNRCMMYENRPCAGCPDCKPVINNANHAGTETSSARFASAGAAGVVGSPSNEMAILKRLVRDQRDFIDDLEAEVADLKTERDALSASRHQLSAALQRVIDGVKSDDPDMWIFAEKALSELTATSDARLNK